MPKSIPLGDAAVTVDYGVTASATKSPIGPKFLRITDIQDGSVNWDNVPWCECDAKTANGSTLASGDIVFARTGATTGKSYLIRECPANSVFASYLIRVRVNKDFDPRFVSHFFQTPNYWAQITKSARGVAQPGVNATTLKSLSIPVFSLPEQKRIAEILDRAEALRAKRRAALALLDELTQSIFLDMFGDPVDAEKWDQKELKDVVREGTIVTYGIVQAGKEFADGVPYIRTGDIIDGDISIDGLRHTDPLVAAKFDRSRVNAGDIVMSIRATVGTTAVVPHCLDGANLTQGTAKIAPGSQVNLEYLLQFLRSGRTQHWISRQIKGATFREITLGRLRQLPVVIPPQNLQKQFASRIESLSGIRKAFTKTETELDALFASLQHRAFRGELSPRKTRARDEQL